jgi:anti-sigma28 factor (negative regulator of flagellin synthesis)
MKINDSLPIVPQPNSDLGKVGVGQNSSSTSVTPQTTPATAIPTPAASIDVTVTAQLSQTQGKKDLGALPDKMLLDKIKAKIASGSFEIDYQQISQAMLHDSLAQIGAKSGK